MTSKTKLPDTSGIYVIRSQVNGKRYVGSAVNLRHRKSGHFCLLEKNRHRNRHLQNHYNKYDKVELQFSIIEYCTKEKLIEREQCYIDTLNPEFNICKVANSRLGCIASEETKKKLRKNHHGLSGKNHPMYGKHHTEETKRKISENNVGNKGRKCSKETKRKIGEGNRGKIVSKETRKKLSEASKGKKGRKHSEETRNKMTIARIAYLKREKHNYV